MKVIIYARTHTHTHTHTQPVDCSTWLPNCSVTNHDTFTTSSAEAINHEWPQKIKAYITATNPLLTAYQYVCTNTTKPTTLINKIFRPHCSTTYVDAAYCCQPSSVVCRSLTLVSCAKTAELIELSFGLRTRVGPGNHGKGQTKWRMGVPL